MSDWKERRDQLLQTKDPECQLLFKRFFEELPLETIKELIAKVTKERRHQEPYSRCTNETLLSGNPIWSYPAKDLILYNENEVMYCFDQNDYLNLLQTKKNPFSGNELSIPFVKQLKARSKDPFQKQLVWPLDMTLEILYGKRRCLKEDYTTPTTVYYYSKNKQLKTVHDLPKEFTVKKRFAPSLYREYVYRLHLSHDLMEIYQNIERKNVVKIEEIYNPITKESGVLPQKTISVDHISNITIDDWCLSKISTFTEKQIKLLELLKAVPKQPVVVYRGLMFKKGFGLFKDVDLFIVGDKITYKFDKPVSWSSNYCVSELFAGPGNDGVIFSTTLQPSDILVDLRMIFNHSQIDHYNQSELVTYPSTTVHLEVVGILKAKKPGDKMSLEYDLITDPSVRTDYLSGFD